MITISQLKETKEILTNLDMEEIEPIINELREGTYKDFNVFFRKNDLCVEMCFDLDKCDFSPSKREHLYAKGLMWDDCRECFVYQLKAET